MIRVGRSSPGSEDFNPAFEPTKHRPQAPADENGPVSL
jgi:hypothetical protein